MTDTIARIVAAYAVEGATVRSVAAELGFKPAEVTAILKVSGVAIRRGNPNLGQLAASGLNTRSIKARDKMLARLVARHGHASVMAALASMQESSAD